MSLSGSNFSLPERAASYRSNSAHLISNRSVSASRASTTSRVSSVSRAPIPQVSKPKVNVPAIASDTAKLKVACNLIPPCIM